MRGQGLLIGVELTRAAAPVLDACREAGLLLLSAGEKVVRLAPPLNVESADCARALKRLRWERERGDIQREIDRLQELGAGQHGDEIDALWQRKKDLLHRIEEVT